MENISKKSNLSLLNNTVTSAATLHMGKSKPSNEDSTYANWNCDCLCETIHQNWQEWIDACREATETIN